MKIIFWGKGSRGESSLKALVNMFDVLSIVIEPNHKERNNEIIEIANKYKIDILSPNNPNNNNTSKLLKSYGADIFILAGYGKILKQNIIDIPTIMSINLHGGKLPDYRGSSPMNWALINGENKFSISIIKLDSGVDTGDILIEKSINISSNDTIADLHKKANREFVIALIKLINNLKNSIKTKRKQNKNLGSYYSIRRPEDGFVLWEFLKAEDIHNRIRALTEPYPFAFSYLKKKKVFLVKSELKETLFIGEPGRIYRISKKKGLLVGASDKCLWIKEAVYADTKVSILDQVQRYDRFARIQDLFDQLYSDE